MIEWKQLTALESYYGADSALYSRDADGAPTVQPMAPLVKLGGWGQVKEAYFAANDAVVSAELTALAAEGWQLVTVTSTELSSTSVLTRYLLRREVD